MSSSPSSGREAGVGSTALVLGVVDDGSFVVGSSAMVGSVSSSVWIDFEN